MDQSIVIVFPYNYNPENINQVESIIYTIPSISACQTLSDVSKGHRSSY